MQQFREVSRTRTIYTTETETESTEESTECNPDQIDVFSGENNLKKE